ncbi:D-alanyl-D-alanine carboxypeptidase/D-alanyl-D-alanine endopeptidase [Halobacillus litoralis]|uniref:D-alanyl-D-alanine carboxypeptidase/D-alanyl-D-alanine endopeptidase n=1 Tax=Halobacillus litoralis TaxID=45668 RepID=UPI001371F91B|nr:D-alanyl-D-alanine carboxypeptidase/D-alanyl-D-alanine-endopeptidase [Halobacillus litoralis]MYL38753.1 D-alanyl-D-alanine carboxypeptidase/D-alanyl-D-alanine-endopeptidase [Halobacillus litoralis]
MKRGSQTAVLLLMSLVLFFPFQPVKTEVTASLDHEKLVDQMNLLLSDEKLDGALSGISIRAADTGEVLYEHDAHDRLKPASNMKLLTGAAAMDTLGIDYTFDTEVFSEGKVRGGNLHGDLYLKGNGDPTLLYEDFQDLAQQVKDSGIKRVKGTLIADDTWYDDIRLSEDISWNDESRYYASQISALTAAPNEDYDAGTVIVAAYPAEKEGEEAVVEVTPETDHVKITNQTKTVAEDGEKDVTIERKHGTNEIIVEGTIPLEGSRSRSWVAVDEPSGLALDLFRRALEEAGIKMKGKVTYAETPEKADLVASHTSMPLEDLFNPFMKLSNNGHAEVLIKEMGRVVHDEGSWDKGLDVVEEYLETIDVGADTMRLRDGSGMSHVNMVPADEISELLYHVQEEPWYEAFYASLPVAGDEERFVGGTLRNRMQDTAAEGNVHAKTGSLTGVTSLSGYVTTKDGEELIFSILLNNYLGSVQEIEDKLAVTLAEYEE